MTQVSCCQFVDPVASFHPCVTEPTCPINTFGHQLTRQSTPHAGTSQPTAPASCRAHACSKALSSSIRAHTQHPMQERSHAQHAQRQLQHQRTVMPSDQHPSRHTYRHCHTCPNNSSSILQAHSHAQTSIRAPLSTAHFHAQTAPAEHSHVLDPPCRHPHMPNESSGIRAHQCTQQPMQATTYPNSSSSIKSQWHPM